MKPEAISRSGRVYAVDSLDLFEGASKAIEDTQKLIKEIRLGRRDLHSSTDRREPVDAGRRLSLINIERTGASDHLGRSHAAESLHLYEGAHRAIEDTKKLIEKITHQTMPWRDSVK